MHETIEGEVIVIDLTTGSYYSLRDAGAEIWHSIQQGTDEEQIDEMLQERYEAPREEIVAAVGRFLDELAREGLIEPSDGDPAAPSAPAAPAQQANGRVPFVAPLIEKHSDMQDLILLDPVHEVGSQGWPHRPEPEARG
jgi:coenzyme PQQ synthesis protein D (PqqD)